MLSKYRFLLLFFILIGLLSQQSYAQKKVSALKDLMQKEDYEGVIVLYDYNKDGLYTSHFNKTDEKVLPASTFKIFNTLLFLELGIVEDTTHTLPWNGKEYKHKGKKVPSWYKDTNLAEAFRNSTVWYYKALGNPIDFNTYKDLMKKNKYGKIFGRDREVIDFWNEGAKIGISARDQIRFLVKIFEDNSTFKTEHLEIVKELMIEDETDEYILRSKTGWTESPEGSFKNSVDLGWYIGYVEQKENSYFFAVRLEKPLDKRKRNFAEDRKRITKKALKKQFGIDVK